MAGLSRLVIFDKQQIEKMFKTSMAQAHAINTMELEIRDEQLKEAASKRRTAELMEKRFLEFKP